MRGLREGGRMSGEGTRTGGLDGALLPANDGDGRPLTQRQRFEYWEVGRRDALDGLPPLRWMKQSWPEDGREAYYEGHAAAQPTPNEREDD